jgi:hypothetical protein
MRTENVTPEKELTIVVFIDIEVAFHRILFSAVTKAAERNSAGTTIVRWMNTTLEAVSATG